MITRDDYMHVINNVLKAAKGMVGSEKIQAFTEHVGSKIVDFKPSIMVYGTYNSGKSTLLNALFGDDDMAPTGDAPTTGRVTPYEYRGVTIYDTPGINAPLEHERVTREHINKSEVVLFVVSNDGSFEEEYIYNEVCELVNLKKPVLFVLNNKKGIDPDSEEAISDLEKVSVNLTRISERNGLDNLAERVTICMVNAKAALKGREEGKELLFKYSQMPQFEDRLHVFINRAGRREVVNTLNHYIRSFIDEVIAVLDDKINNCELKEIEKIITWLDKTKQNTVQAIEHRIAEATGNMPVEFVDKFMDGGSNVELECYVKAVGERLVCDVNSMLQDTCQELKTKVEGFDGLFQEVVLSGENKVFVPGEALPEKNVHFEMNELPSAISASCLVPSASLVQSNFFKFLPIPTADMINLFMVLFMELNAIIRRAKEKEKEAEQYIQAKKRRVLVLRSEAERIMFRIKSDTMRQVRENLDGMFDPVIEHYRSLSDNFSKGHEELLERKQLLQQCREWTNGMDVMVNI